MKLLQKILATCAEKPTVETFDPDGLALPVTIRKISMFDHEAITAKIDRVCKPDDPGRSMMLLTEVFKVALLEDDGVTRAVTNDKDIVKLKEDLGVTRCGELMAFVAGIGMGQTKKVEDEDVVALKKELGEDVFANLVAFLNRVTEAQKNAGGRKKE